MKRLQKGFGLIELLMVLGVITVGMSSVYGVYRVVHSAQKSSADATEIQAMADRIAAAYVSSPNYRLLNQQVAIDQNLFGPRVRIEEGRAMGSWGGEVRVATLPATIQGQSVNDAAFSLTLTNVPSDACMDLAPRMAKNGAEVRVNDQTLFQAHLHQADPSLVGQLCGQANTVTMSFVYARQESSSGLVACQPPDAPQEQTVPCSALLTGSQIQRRTGHCEGAYGNIVWSEWTTVGGQCVPCPVSDFRTAACLPGQFGSESQIRLYDCAKQKWGDWETQSSTCQACPSDQTEAVACPTGSKTTTRTRSFDCSKGEWGPWFVKLNACSTFPPSGGG